MLCKSVLINYITASMIHNRLNLLKLIVRKKITPQIIENNLLQKTDTECYDKLVWYTRSILVGRCILGK